MQQYKWKMLGFAHGIDPNLAVQELDRIRSIYGKITPEIVVAESLDEKSVLHKAFEWDNDKAASGFRLQQARMLLNNIQVTIVDDGKPREIAVYEVTSRSEGYKNFKTFTVNDISYIKSEILCQLNLLKAKLQTYKEFDKVLCHVNTAIMELS